MIYKESYRNRTKKILHHYLSDAVLTINLINNQYNLHNNINNFVRNNNNFLWWGASELCNGLRIGKDGFFNFRRRHIGWEISFEAHFPIEGYGVLLSTLHQLLIHQRLQPCPTAALLGAELIDTYHKLAYRGVKRKRLYIFIHFFNSLVKWF